MRFNTWERFRNIRIKRNMKEEMKSTGQGKIYPPIRDYGYIGDCHSAALVSRWGSIDWCCMARIDSSSCFGRLLDWEKGGYCQIAPTDPYEVTRGYLGETLALETSFRTSEGEARLVDFFTMREGGAERPHKQILRIVEGRKGRVRLGVYIAPRFDYGAIRPWICPYRGSCFIAMGGSDGLLFSGDFALEKKDHHDLAGFCTVREGQRIRLSIIYQKPEFLEEGLIEVPDAEELDRRFEETLKWWESWAPKEKIEGPYADLVRRSAVVLKGLSNAPTGAIAAAATTSLPEAPGGARNWDYRFSWIRDSTLALRSLGELGYTKEVDGFRRFVQRSAAGSAEELQILFGVGGERRLHEFALGELEGYGGARPVRVGNAAETQRQLDVYGEVLDLAWRWHRRGKSPDEDYWDFIVDLVNTTMKLWDTPDRGIWEIRGEPRHFTYSKAMCWVAFDRGTKLAKELGREAPMADWEKKKKEVRKAIEREGYDGKRGVFIQAFGWPVMDASLLLLPIVGFVDFKDERMVRTTDRIMEELDEGGLLRRYPFGNDSLEGKEGVFIACTFWLAECLARQGRLDLARKFFKRALATQNDLGLFSEEFEPETKEMLGNFPQAFTHLSFISAAVALGEGDRAPFPPSPP
jgi:GH15 family glucan-1,4-alpha-glucosidase